ncbi:MAG: dipeptidase [Chloroflexia bacterium]
MGNVHAQALEVHRRAIVCDAHCDTLLALEHTGRSLGERSALGHVDLPRLTEGGVTAQVFAVFVEAPYYPMQAARRTLALIDLFYRELERNAAQMRLATRGKDIREAKEDGQIAAILGLEGGEALEGDLSLLRIYYRLGVRLVTITWNRRNALADGLGEARSGGGLTNLGVEAVREMNRLGILIDISHLAPAGVRDVLEVSQAPVIASHSNARAVFDHPRNLNDDQVQAVAEKGGVVCVTFVPDFVGGKEASLEQLLDHVEHLLRVAGEDHVGLGSDFDGFGFGSPGEAFQDIPDVRYLPRLTEGMLRRGIPPRVAEKVLGGNFLRLFEQVVG